MIHFDKDCEPANDIVVLRIIDNDTLSSKSTGFVIGDETLRNLRVGFAKIEKIGKEAKEKTGLDAGAYVFYDKLATFYHTEPVAMLRWNALIMESNLEKTMGRNARPSGWLRRNRKPPSSTVFRNRSQHSFCNLHESKKNHPRQPQRN